MIHAGIMDKKELEKFMSNHKVCVIDFSATWCGPCKMLAPVIEDAAEKHDGEYGFINIDVDSAEDLAREFKIQFVPTIVVMVNGKEASRTSGYMELEDLEKFIKGAIK